ncbi:MAG: hypothetical protein D8B38_02730 [Candidatus Saccharimonas sp.]|nr:MAG: hypothetical protein D8B38_02730 [Candidatus Saccharimonas sp.]
MALWLTHLKAYLAQKSYHHIFMLCVCVVAKVDLQDAACIKFEYFYNNSFIYFCTKDEWVGKLYHSTHYFCK